MVGQVPEWGGLCRLVGPAPALHPWGLEAPNFPQADPVVIFRSEGGQPVIFLYVQVGEGGGGGGGGSRGGGRCRLRKWWGGIERGIRESGAKKEDWPRFRGTGGTGQDLKELGRILEYWPGSEKTGPGSEGLVRTCKIPSYWPGSEKTGKCSDRLVRKLGTTGS